MPDPLFRLACLPAAFDGAPDGWAATLLAEGELALLVGPRGLDAINAVAQELDLVSVPVLRTEATPEAQERTVMAYAGSFPLVWIASAFSDAARREARERGPMTLLVEADGGLSGEDRRLVERFVASLGRQAE